MDTIQIRSRLYDYTVDFTDDFTKELSGFGQETVYVIDKNVYHLYEEKFARIDREKLFLMEPAEKKKNMDTVMELILRWKQLGVKKNWKVVCFGGGISQDVTTIASNLFLRNVEWYFFPTTLLSMCDSCIGGKCGINLGQYKNQIGVFYPPKKIFIDIGFLRTLSEADYLNGWGELLKFSLTSEASFYQEVKEEGSYIPCPEIGRYIYKGLFVKKTIIEEDEFESDLRRVLNYGHSFGHALEAYTNHGVPHGKAVIWGIDVVNYIAWQEKLIPEEMYRDIKRVIKTSFIKDEVVIDSPEAIFEILKTDKKVKGNKLAFAMLDGPSHLTVYPMELDGRLEKMFEDYLEETHEYYNH